MEKYDPSSTNLQIGLKILTFTATWCGDCKFIEPFMPIIEKNNPNFEFIEVDIDKYSELADNFKIKGIPSFVAINEGEEIGRFVNGDRKTKPEIEDFIKGLSVK